MSPQPAPAAQAALASGQPLDVPALLADHPFTDGFDEDTIERLAQHTGVIDAPAGRFLLHHGQPAEVLNLLIDGDVAVEVHHPTGATVIIETLHPGDVLGWSWLFEPRRWKFDARATCDARALVVDAAALRIMIDGDPQLGRTVALRMGSVLADRLTHARRQLVSAFMP